MKRIVCLFAALLLTLSAFTFSTAAATPAKDIIAYVTVSDGNGAVKLTQAPVTASDRNKDGKISVDEVLFAAHEKHFEGGAAAGYASSMGSYGLQLDKLWGVANGGNYGYYVDHKMADNLDETVKDGAYLDAFIYQDTASYSDVYCYFERATVKGEPNSNLDLTLLYLTYNTTANAMVALPLKGATITLNGEASVYKTDDSGKVTVKIDKEGKCVVSATHETMKLVPPVCTANIATTTTTNVLVTIADDKGELVLKQESITVFDTDSDGILTVHDALFCAHEKHFKGGAEEGYAASLGAYGLKLDTLWGITNGGNYGYFVNSKPSNSLLDKVTGGSRVDAFVYRDTVSYSDIYSYFDVRTKTAKEGEAFTLQLFTIEYDPVTYAPNPVPLKNTAITVNGSATEYKTDGDGKVSITLNEAGTYVISAKSDDESKKLVPPVARVTVSAQPTTPNSNNSQTPSAEEEKPNMVGPIVAVSVVGVVVVGAVVAFFIYRKKNK